MRQIVLDTETTGLDPADGHRIIEIGCVELINRRLTGNNFHQYLNPERDIDPGAEEVHGLSSKFLADKPLFADIANDFMHYIKDAELVIHNAPFDVGFIDQELKLLGKKWGKVEDYATVLDTLAMARQMHPGQKNTLDALCNRYEVDNSERELHGALLDAEILADVYLAMTGGQANLSLGVSDGTGLATEKIRPLDSDRPALKVIRASREELEAHLARLDAIDDASDEKCVWRTLGDSYP